MLSLGGFYAIYRNKNLWGKAHFTTTHGQAGAAILLSAIGAGMVGGVVLHPDFGIDKTNKTIRYVHKTFARGLLMAAWGTAFYGFYTMTSNPVDLAIFGLPLLALAPYSLV
jgi:Eukaryotic cytochrome b561